MKTKEEQLPAAIAEAFRAPSNEHYLLMRYGATMSLDDLAGELGTTSNALRIRQLRYGDLPPRIRGLRAYRCPTGIVAAWIATLVDSQSDATPIRHAESVHEARRPGRPRKHRVTAAHAETAEDA